MARISERRAGAHAARCSRLRRSRKWARCPRPRPRPSRAAPRPPAWPSAARPGSRSRSGPSHNPWPPRASGTNRRLDGSCSAKPNATQIKFFNANEGGISEAGIAILRPAAQTEPDLQARRAEPAGQAPALLRQDRPSSRWKTTIPREEGATSSPWTVPSWAPALALGFAGDTSWQGREQAAERLHQHEQPDRRHRDRLAGSKYYCLYQTARPDIQRRR